MKKTIAAIAGLLCILTAYAMEKNVTPTDRNSTIKTDYIVLGMAVFGAPKSA